eukprot:1798059-Alexandrium_andersonii.AAC.1
MDDGDSKVDCFSACDKDAACLRFLASHTGTSRPRHLFQNIEHRWPAEVINHFRQRGHAVNEAARLRIQREGKVKGVLIKETS